MNIYKLTQTENNDYDTFDAIIVTAKTEQDARAIHPEQNSSWFTLHNWTEKHATWATDPSHVTATLIGVGNHEAGLIIMTSFNAG